MYVIAMSSHDESDPKYDEHYDVMGETLTISW